MIRAGLIDAEESAGVAMLLRETTPGRPGTITSNARRRPRHALRESVSQRMICRNRVKSPESRA